MKISADIKPVSYLKLPRAALGLLKLLAQAENDIRGGNVTHQAQVFDNVEALLNNE